MSFNFITDNENDKIGYRSLKKAISEQLSIDFEKNISINLLISHQQQ